MTSAANLVEISDSVVGNIFQSIVSSTSNVRLRERKYKEYPMYIWVFTSSHYRIIPLDTPRYELYAKKLAKAYNQAGLESLLLRYIIRGSGEYLTRVIERIIFLSIL